MEVEKSEISYSLYVPADSELPPQAPAAGSGTVTGTVIGGDDNDCDRASVRAASCSP